MLGVCAEALEERERLGRRRRGVDGGKEEEEEVGVRAVLRGLSRLI